MKLFKGFKKQPQSVDETEERGKVKAAEYKIILKEKLGSTTRTIKTFKASRFVDDTDHVVYLKNDKLNFVEIFPQQHKDFSNYTEQEVDEQLKKFKDKLAKEREFDDDKINDKDLEFEIMKLEAKKRSFKYDENSSYLSLDENNKPEFYFLREGSTMHPYKWDSETKTIFVPSDNKKKSLAIALRNKQFKYSKLQQQIPTITIILLFLMVGVLFGGGYMWYKANQANTQAFESYDESRIAAMERAAADAAARCAEVTASNAESANEIFDLLRKNSELRLAQSEKLNAPSGGVGN